MSVPSSPPKSFLKGKFLKAKSDLNSMSESFTIVEYEGPIRVHFIDDKNETKQRQDLPQNHTSSKG